MIRLVPFIKILPKKKFFVRNNCPRFFRQILGYSAAKIGQNLCCDCSRWGRSENWLTSPAMTRRRWASQWNLQYRTRDHSFKQRPFTSAVQRCKKCQSLRSMMPPSLLQQDRFHDNRKLSDFVSNFSNFLQRLSSATAAVTVSQWKDRRPITAPQWPSTSVTTFG